MKNPNEGSPIKPADIPDGDHGSLMAARTARKIDAAECAQQVFGRLLGNFWQAVKGVKSAVSLLGSSSSFRSVNLHLQ